MVMTMMIMILEMVIEMELEMVIEMELEMMMEMMATSVFKTANRSITTKGRGGRSNCQST